MAVTTAFLTAVTLSGLNSSAAFAATPPGCPNVLLIGARGSGETDLRSSGLGPEVLTLYKQLQSDLNGKLKVKSLSVVYTAESTEILRPTATEISTIADAIPFGPAALTAAILVVKEEYQIHHLDKFLSSIDEGLTSAMQELSTEAIQCPNTRFVLAGYSQGAMVMHQLLLRLTDAPNRALLQRVAATALIADGDRVKGTSALSFWSSAQPPAKEGIETAFRGGGPDVPMQPLSYSICNKDDFVCDFDFMSFLHYNKFVDIHTNSYLNSKLVKVVGTAIAKQLLNQASAPIDHIVISPGNATIGLGQTQSYTAEAFDSANRSLGDITASTTFSISPDGACTGAVCTASIPGAHTVNGTTSGKTGTATLNIQPIPTGLASFHDITTALRSTMALRTDGTVWAWGYNGYGQLGNGTTTDSAVPVQVTGLTGVLTVTTAADGNAAFALKTDGTMWAWGRNDAGQLGNGTRTDSAVPVQVTGLTGVQNTTTDGASVFAVKADGAVWAWGYNGRGQLGNGTRADSTVPVQVTGLTGVRNIRDENSSVLAEKMDGTVWAWGYNGYGQLGDGTTTDSAVPVQVTGLTGVRNITTGVYSSFAVKNDGTVWAWGHNISGQLGNSTTTDSAVPVQVRDLAGVQNVSVAKYIDTSSVYAAKTDGTVWAWGFNDVGQLGNSTTSDSAVPVQVTGLTGVQNISADGSSAIALKTDGTVWAWGYNVDGQLGNGTTSDSAVPVQVTGLTGVQNINTGIFSAFAVKADGTAWAWGYNGFGQLGNGTTTNSAVPVQVG